MHVDDTVRHFLCLEHIHKQLQNNGHWVYRNVWRQSAGYLVQQGCMQNMAKAQHIEYILLGGWVLLESIVFHWPSGQKTVAKEAHVVLDSTEFRV